MFDTLKALYLIILAPLVFLGTFAILGIGWALFFGELTDRLDSKVDKWVFRIIYLLALLGTIWIYSYMWR